MKRLYLHVGKHKTGTTSIQRYLQDNAAFFAAHGYHVVRNRLHDDAKPVPGHPATNCFRLAHLVLRRSLTTPARLMGRVVDHPPAERIARIVRMNRALRQSPHDRIIVSAESFSFLRTGTEKLLFRLLFRGLDLVPIVTLRDRADWMRSWRTMMWKVAPDASPAEARATIFDYRDDSWLLADEAIVKFFGRRSIVLDYDREHGRDGSIIPGFLRALGLDPAQCPAWDRYRFNVSTER